MRKEDRFGNLLFLKDGTLWLKLKYKGYPLDLGSVSARIWLVVRKPSGEAKKKGHYLHKQEGWGINFAALTHHEQIGRDRIHFIGHDGEDKRYEFTCTVAEMLDNTRPFQFSGKGFELQKLIPRKFAERMMQRNLPGALEPEEVEASASSAGAIQMKQTDQSDKLFCWHDSAGHPVYETNYYKFPILKGCCDPPEIPKPQNLLALLQKSIERAKRRKR